MLSVINLLQWPRLGSSAHALQMAAFEREAMAAKPEPLVDAKVVSTDPSAAVGAADKDAGPAQLTPEAHPAVPAPALVLRIEGDDRCAPYSKV